MTSDTFFQKAGDGEDTKKTQKTVNQCYVEVDVTTCLVCEQGDQCDSDDRQQIDGNHAVDGVRLLIVHYFDVTEYRRSLFWAVIAVSALLVVAGGIPILMFMLEGEG